ncbi:CLUMA_CG008688, isoform A [Clunio marinus]|uniref:CLUMA_CG008688, isoform A n=1 Tax=Clunio marinus TaxID=568069 RepID=A0A1J1IA42_9DIPT|nr:CLUMA_CG008688, isoform A [Clunio marinus]
MIVPLASVLFSIGAEAQQRRLRLRSRPVQQIESGEEETSEEIGRPVIQYYRPQPKQDNAQELVYVNEEEYQNLYGGQVTPTARPREYNRPAVTTVRPISRSHNLTPRTKDSESKAPPVQTIRNYNKVNDDGSFTFGYEAADGSFKEETRGTDCVVRGRYGYIDPEGNKREFTYVSGNPCDPNNPDASEEEDERNQSVEDSDENIPQNYPKRPIVQRPRPTVPSTTRAPTTVFQNRYNHQSLASEEEEEEDVGAIQYAQIPKTSPRPAYVQPTPQRPRIQVIQTTQAPSPPVTYASPSATPSINITPKPLYRIQNNVLSLQQTKPSPPATTYRPQTVSFVTPKPAHVTTPNYPTRASQDVTFASGSTRGAIDFDAEFKKFQNENVGGFKPITPSPVAQTTKSVKIPKGSSDGSNPIYQTQLVYNPSSGQYDSALYQSIAQTDSEFQLNQRIQPYVPQYPVPQYQVYRPQPQPQPQSRPQPQAQRQQAQQQQIPQQIYQKQQNELQFVNSQQLFAQQLQMQQSQLHRDRIEAAKKHQSPAHRFQLQQAEPSPILQSQLRAQPGQQFYYIQPSSQQSSGQIEAFLRGHNLEY